MLSKEFAIGVVVGTTAMIAVEKYNKSHKDNKITFDSLATRMHAVSVIKLATLATATFLSEEEITHMRDNAGEQFVRAVENMRDYALQQRKLLSHKKQPLIIDTVAIRRTKRTRSRTGAPETISLPTISDPVEYMQDQLNTLDLSTIEGLNTPVENGQRETIQLNNAEGTKITVPQKIPAGLAVDIIERDEIIKTNTPEIAEGLLETRFPEDMPEWGTPERTRVEQIWIEAQGLNYDDENARSTELEYFDGETITAEKAFTSLYPTRRKEIREDAANKATYDKLIALEQQKAEEEEEITAEDVSGKGRGRWSRFAGSAWTKAGATAALGLFVLASGYFLKNYDGLSPKNNVPAFTPQPTLDSARVAVSSPQAIAIAGETKPNGEALKIFDKEMTVRDIAKAYFVQMNTERQDALVNELNRIGEVLSSAKDLAKQYQETKKIDLESEVMQQAVHAVFQRERDKQPVVTEAELTTESGYLILKNQMYNDPLTSEPKVKQNSAFILPSNEEMKQHVDRKMAGVIEPLGTPTSPRVSMTATPSGVVVRVSPVASPLPVEVVPALSPAPTEDAESLEPAV